MTVKKDGAGARAWGKPGDEIKYQNDAHFVNENDPNYDPLDGAHIAPTLEAQARFVSSAADLANYKKAIKEAIAEYLSNGDEKEFSRVVVELDMTVYHQELTKIVVTKALDLSAADRVKLSSLLAHLHTEGHLTAAQSKAGFLKIYNRLDEILVDAPNAPSILKEFTSHALSNGFLEQADIEDLDQEAKILANHTEVASIKSRISSIIKEHMTSEDIQDTAQSITELNAPKLGFEVVKKIMYKACDGNHRSKYLASKFLAEVPAAVISKDQISKGFSILLERTEDMLLDTPNILQILSTFIARAIVDEALPPAFLVRQDLGQKDMGFQVVEHAQQILAEPKARQRLSCCWLGQEEE